MPIIGEESKIDSYFYKGFDIEIHHCKYTDGFLRYWSRFQRPTDKYAYTAGVWDTNLQAIYRNTLIRIDWLLDMVSSEKASLPVDFSLHKECLTYFP